MAMRALLTEINASIFSISMIHTFGAKRWLASDFVRQRERDAGLSASNEAATARCALSCRPSAVALS